MYFLPRKYLRSCQIQFDWNTLTRICLKRFKNPFLNRITVYFEFPFQPDILQSCKISAIQKFQFSLLKVNCSGENRLYKFFKFLHRRMRLTVRPYKAIYAEISIIRFITKISSVIPMPFTIQIQPLVYPIPYESPLKTVILAYYVPVV